MLRTVLAVLLAAQVMTARAEQEAARPAMPLPGIDLVSEGPEGLSLLLAPSSAPVRVRVAVPPEAPSIIARAPALGPEPLPLRVVERGWRGLAPFAVVELTLPAAIGPIAVDLSFAPGPDLPADVPRALMPAADVPALAGLAPMPATPLLNEATARAIAARASGSALAAARPRLALPGRAPGQTFRLRAPVAPMAGERRLGPVGMPPAAPAAFDGARVRIMITPDAPGVPAGPALFRLTASMLVGLGLDLADVRFADLRLVTLDTRSPTLLITKVPLRRHDPDGNGLFGVGEWIEFWGEPMLGESFRNEYQGADFTDDRGYVLDVAPADPSPVMDETLDARPVSPATPDFLATAHAERDDLFLNNTRAGRPAIDHFYWCSTERLSWAGGAEARRTETVVLPRLASTSARRGAIRARLLHRLDDQPASPDFRSVLDLNARASLSDITGDGFAVVEHEATGLVAGTDLVASSTVVLRAPGMPGAAANLFELDEIEIDYPRTFDVDGGKLVFTHAPGASVVARGLTSPDVTVLDVTEPFAPRVAQNVVLAAGTAAFELAGGPDPVRYAVQETPPGEPAILPLSLSLLGPPTLRGTSAGGDVVVIGPRAWVEPPLPGLSRWMAHRQGQGLAVRLVATEDLVDEFAAGTFTPFVLGAMLAEAMASWTPAPRYALLLGDASMDYKDLTGGVVLDGATCTPAPDPCGQNETAWVQHVPTRIFDSPGDTQFLGWFASDVISALVVGADWEADVAIGRLPVRSAAEADAALDKVIAHENAALLRAPWTSRVLLVADKIALPIEQSFETFQNDARDAHVLPRFSATELYYQRDFGGGPPEPFTQELHDTWTDPLRSGAVLSYVGHGSAYRWSSDDVLLNRGTAPCRNDVTALSGAGLPEPFVLNSNCITGTFTYSLGPSLLEELVRAPAGGAIAAYGPTGISELGDAQDVLNAAYGRMHGRDGRDGRAGDVALAVQHSLGLLAAVDPAPLLSHAFLGDPSLRLAIPYGPAAVGLTAVPGDAIVDLSWPATPGAATHDLWRSDTGVGGTYERIAIGLTGTTHRDAGDPPGPLGPVVNNQLYHYALEAVDADGHPGKWSPRVPARPCSMAPPQPAGAITLTPGACTGSFTVRWGASATPGLQGYRLRVYRGALAQGVPVRTMLAPGIFASVTGLIAWQQYAFTVSPVTWCDVEGPASGPVTGRSTCALALDPPAFITDLRLARSGPADVALTWSPVSETVRGTPATIAGYRVFRSGSAGFVADATSEVASPATPGHVDGNRVGAAPSLEFYAVSAVDSAGRRGGAGHDLPQGVRNVSVTDLGAELELTWAMPRYDIRGEITPLGSFDVYQSDTALDRARIETESLVPVTTVAAPPARIPDVPGFTNIFVVPQDIHGTRSAD